VRGSSFAILLVCLGVIVFSGCAKYESDFVGRKCASDADCHDGYHCDLDVERCRKDCVPDCEGRCCGSDGCGGTCPAGCPEGEICDWSTCWCEVVKECETNDDCPEDYWCDRTDWTCRSFDCIPNCAGKCCGSDGCGGTCPNNCPAGFYCHLNSCECRPEVCQNDSDCMQSQCCLQSVCFYMACGDLECGPDPVCHKECGPCPGGQVCLDGICVTAGDGLPGDPCTFGDVNDSAGDCTLGLACLGVLADGTAGTCPGGAPDECVEIPDSFNPDCISGNCGFSFCSEECDVQGNCPAGFEPVDVYGICYCIPA